MSTKFREESVFVEEIEIPTKEEKKELKRIAKKTLGGSLVKYDPKNVWWKADKIEFMFVIIIVAFTFCTTYNFLLLNIETYDIPLLEEFWWLAVKMIAIGSLTYATAVMRMVSDNAKLEEIITFEDEEGNIHIKTRFVYEYDDFGNKRDLTLTRTSVEGFFSPESIWDVFKGFGVAFAVSSFISYVLFGHALSIYDIALSQIAFAVITAVSEELLFTYGFQSVLMPYLNGFSIVFTTGLFVLYHGIVYATEITALLFTAFARIVYALVYIWNRRISSLCLAHMLNNILAFGGVSTGLSVFYFLLPI